MKSISGPLLTLLQSNQQFILADLYTFTLVSGLVLQYTDIDGDLVTPDSRTFYSNGPPLLRTKTRLVIGLEVDTLDVSIFPRPVDMLGSVPMVQAVTGGAFDGGRLKLERAYITRDPSTQITTVVGTIHMFSGLLADTQISRTEIKLRVNSDISALQVQMPRNLYQPSCLHTLYDSDCTVSRAAFAVGSSVLSGSTASVLNCGITNPTGYFERGYVQFNSGALIGTKRTVKGSASGVLSVFTPFPQIPGIGDTFTVYPGCDRTQSTCTNKYNNVIHFRAMPYIPTPETVL